MKTLFTLFAFIFISPIGYAQMGYKIGDKIEDFTLINSIDNASISLNSFNSSKVVVVVFTSHNCPYSKIYEQRAKNFITSYESKGVKFIFINPNNSTSNPEESSEEMMKAAKERGFMNYYLIDSDQSTADKFGATKTPEVFVLKYQSGGFVLKYKGAIDDNAQVASDVTANYLRDALEATLSNQPVKITEKKATGCMIHR